MFQNSSFIFLSFWSCEKVFKTNQKTEVIPHKEASAPRITADYISTNVDTLEYYIGGWWESSLGISFFMLKCRYLCDYYYGFVCNRSVVLKLQYRGHKDGAQILALIIYLPTKMARDGFFTYCMYRHFYLNNVINEQKNAFQYGDSNWEPKAPYSLGFDSLTRFSVPTYIQPNNSESTKLNFDLH